MNYKTLFCFLFTIASLAQKQYSFENIQLNNSHLFYDDKHQEQEIVLSLIDAFFSKNISDEDRMTFWKVPKNPIYLAGNDLCWIHQKAKMWGDYTPSILSMLYIDEKYQIRVAWIGNSSKDDKILTIYNFLVDKDYQFVNVFDNQFNTLTKRKIKNLTFYYKNPKLFRKKDVKKALKFNKQIAEFFELPEIDFSCFIFNSYFEQKQFRGFDFDTDMRIGESYGGVAFPEQKEIFSGNGTAYYPHEIVHLYTYQKAKNKNLFIDEGIATYFGGSRGLHFSELMQDFYPFLLKENVNIYNLLSQYEFVAINTKVDSFYSFAALLCHTILKYHSKEKLFELLDSGNDWEEFLCKIEETFNLKPEEFHSFFLEECKKVVMQQKFIPLH